MTRSRPTGCRPRHPIARILEREDLSAHCGAARPDRPVVPACRDGDDDNAATRPVGALSTPPCTAEASAVRIPIDDGVASRGGSVMSVPMLITPEGSRG